MAGAQPEMNRLVPSSDELALFREEFHAIQSNEMLPNWPQSGAFFKDPITNCKARYEVWKHTTEDVDLKLAENNRC
jgi:hypothetical protein